jgi:hypothetical protein
MYRKRFNDWVTPNSKKNKIKGRYQIFVPPGLVLASLSRWLRPTFLGLSDTRDRYEGPGSKAFFPWSPGLDMAIAERDRAFFAVGSGYWAKALILYPNQH